MQKTLMVISILFSAMGLRSVASAIESSSNQIVAALQRAGLTAVEIQDLDNLLQADRAQFQRAIEQDYRIKGKLRLEVMALSNGIGAGPCIQKNQN